MRNTVLTYLEKTVEKFPDRTAIVDSNGSITFAELSVNAKRLAGKIHAQCDCVKSPVLVYLPKSCNSIVAFMGILYSGNFYTPTDVDFPFEKVNSILKVLEPNVFVTDSKYKEKLLQNGIDESKVVNIDEISDCEEFSYEEKIIDTDIVYTLFTSGSTGIPKGVAICNRSIIDYIDWVVKTFDVNENDKIGNQAPFYFDNSTLDIYSCIATGATLYIIKKTNFAFPVKLIQFVNEKNINMVFWVPSVLNAVANADILSRVECKCLNKILFAGEVMPNKQLNYWRKWIPNALYANLYGPTEITVDCTYYIVDREFKDDEPLPIGIPCSNSDVMILDENGKRISEPDKIGELCVRGTSLALGYYRNPGKTAEAFVQNPLHNDYPEKIYKIGDLVYYNDKNEIMFSGRKDFQIKHLGHRIELGEIENAALGLEAIKNVCALYDTEKQNIVLFYQGDVGDKEVLQHMMKIIPQYMIPNKFIKLERFPFNDNGKIDRKTLAKQMTGGGARYKLNSIFTSCSRLQIRRAA